MSNKKQSTGNPSGNSHDRRKARREKAGKKQEWQKRNEKVSG